METQTTKPVKVTRNKPCNCGCHGKDPWHAATFLRIVKNIVEVPVGMIDPNECRKVVIATGEIQAPWGTQAVQLETYTVNGKLSSYRTWTFKR